MDHFFCARKNKYRFKNDMKKITRTRADEGCVLALKDTDRTQA